MYQEGTAQYTTGTAQSNDQQNSHSKWLDFHKKFLYLALFPKLKSSIFFLSSNYFSIKETHFHLLSTINFSTIKFYLATNSNNLNYSNYAEMSSCMSSSRVLDIMYHELFCFKFLKNSYRMFIKKFSTDVISPTVR